MSSVIQSRNEKEKKQAQAEDRRKREKRRQKELAGINGAVTPEDEDEEEDKVQTLPTRLHQSKAGRSMSPAVGRERENGHGGISGTLSGGQGHGTARDSFLNYFFGKEGGLPAAGPPLPQPAQGGSRHVSHSIEPSFSQSIRRTERGSFTERSPLPQYGVTHDEYGSSEYGETSLFVSSSYHTPSPLSATDNDN
jgi:dynamin 1-like protein